MCPQQQRDVGGAAKAVVAVLDQRHLHIVRMQRFGEPERDVPRHIGIRLPVQQAHRTGQRDAAIQQPLRLRHRPKMQA